MQILKENVREKILKEAAVEFRRFGFEKASLRRIAAKSGVTAGNVYRYFKGKDDLLASIARPVFEEIQYFIKHHHEFEFAQSDEALGPLIQAVSARMADFILAHRDALRILIDGSTGTKFSKAKAQLVGFMRIHVIEHLQETYAPEKASQLSVSAQVLSVSFLEGFYEMIRRNLARRELVCAIENYLDFYLRGFMQAFNLQLPVR